MTIPLPYGSGILWNEMELCLSLGVQGTVKETNKMEDN